MASHKTRLAATTYERYNGLLKNNMAEIHQEQVESLTLGRLERHYTLLRAREIRGKTLSETTISDVHDLLRSSLAHAFAVETISKNVLERPETISDPSAKKTEARALTAEGARAVLGEMHRTRLRPGAALGAVHRDATR